MPPRSWQASFLLAVWSLQVTAGGKKAVAAALAESAVKDTAQSVKLAELDQKIAALAQQVAKIAQKVGA